jgi:uncharacterized protein (TIGR02231 family)
MIALLLASLAYAQDYAAQAEDLMDLSYDLEAVETRLRAKKAPAPAPRAPAASAGEAAYYDYQTAVALPVHEPLPLEPNSELDTVVVFRDRALVTRTRTVTVEKGARTVVFEGLPLGLAEDSLHASVREGKVRIVGVELESGAGDLDPAREEALKKEMLAITEDLGQVRDRVEALLAQRAFLRSSLTTSGDRPLPSLGEVKGTLTFVGDAERDIAAKLRKELDAAQELDEKLSPLLIKLDDPLATGRTVKVEVDAPQGGEVELALRYQVFGARWYPAYNARLDDVQDRVTVEYFGLVSQETGEIWKDAELFLSTADPSVSGTLPRLESWILGRDGYDPGVYAALDTGRGSFTNPTTRATDAVAPTGVVDSDMSAMVQGSGSVVFKIPGRRTITGDGSSQRLPVGTQTFPAAIELATVPKVVPEVYRTGRLRYEGQAPLLPGDVATFVGGDFVGTGTIATTVPGETLSLAFGTDDSLEVVRQLVSRQQEAVGFGKNTVRYTFRFRIEVQNFGTEAREILVTDQVPISEIDRVTVTLLESTPALPPTEDDPPGVTKWKVNVPPGGKQAIELAFSVTAPREVPLYQLEAMF